MPLLCADCRRPRRCTTDVDDSLSCRRNRARRRWCWHTDGDSSSSPRPGSGRSGEQEWRERAFLREAERVSGQGDTSTATSSNAALTPSNNGAGWPPATTNSHSSTAAAPYYEPSQSGQPICRTRPSRCDLSLWSSWALTPDLSSALLNPPSPSSRPDPTISLSVKEGTGAVLREVTIGPGTYHPSGRKRGWPRKKPTLTEELIPSAMS